MLFVLTATVLAFAISAGFLRISVTGQEAWVKVSINVYEATRRFINNISAVKDIALEPVKAASQVLLNTIQSAGQYIADFAGSTFQSLMRGVENARTEGTPTLSTGDPESGAEIPTLESDLNQTQTDASQPPTEELPLPPLFAEAIAELEGKKIVLEELKASIRENWHEAFLLQCCITLLSFGVVVTTAVFLVIEKNVWWKYLNCLVINL